MPATHLLFYREKNECPFLDWFEVLNEEPQDELRALFELLSRFGHELRHPYVENLGGGLYELRGRVGRVNYWALYFFHGQADVVLTHGFVKEGRLPLAEIKRAAERKGRFEASPSDHYYDE